MPAAHHKLRRKELKQKDEFLTLVGQASQFVRTHVTQMLVSAAVISAAVVLAAVFYAYSRHRARIAGEQFYQAFAAFNTKQYDTALQRFTELAENESGHEVGRLARFYIGASYLAKDDAPKARDAFVAFLQDARDPAFKTIALMDLGVTYERMGDLKKAEDYYRQASSAHGPQGIRAELSAARVLEGQGNRAAAISAYQRFVEEHPFALERQDAVEALARLGVVVPESRAATR